MQDLSKAVTKTFLLLISLAFCALAVDCFNPFSPSVIGPSALKPIAPQVNPDSVLHNFKYAYENRDGIVYENCLDPDFIFVYIDQDEVTLKDEPVEVPRDGKGGDIYRTKGLFRAFDDIRLDTWKVSEASDSIVGEEVWKVRNVTFHLSLRDTDGDYDYLHMEATGFAEFLFRQSEEDNLWRIVRWIDRSI
ncbi:MAG: hypothetical protein KAW02_03600 [candidate division Zixibacteria bacterium]|nr:hypothetical protein [candidate division Zixibacteria bacterium]